MLALSASELAATSAPDLQSSAISHRILAIKSVSKALSHGVRSFEESNAMLATCYVLAFQSALLDDGLPECMAFIRGSVLVSLNMDNKQLKCLFKSLLGEEHLSEVEQYAEGCPSINTAIESAACTSLEAVGMLCEQDSEIVFYGLLLDLARSLHRPTRDSK